MKLSLRDWLPKRRWFQFSLSTFFILVTLFAIWLGYISLHAREQRAAVARIKALGGSVSYDYQRGSNPQQTPPGWPWLRRLVGDEYFQEVGYINLEKTKVSDEDLRLISKLRRTQTLSLGRTDISDAGIEFIRGMSELNHLGLLKTKVTTEGILRLPQSREWRSLGLTDTSVGDAALSNLTHCKILSLEGTPVTSQGVKKLAESKSLTMLALHRTAVDDEAVPYLAQIKTLASLSVWETKISGEGLYTLRDALPKCEIETMGKIADFRGQFNPLGPGPTGSGWQQAVAGLLERNHSRKLKLLVLADPLVKDGHLATLEGLDHLDTLDLRGASVTEEGVEKLQKALPKLKIHR